jgi:phage/plasmid-associated DNA primase
MMVQDKPRPKKNGTFGETFTDSDDEAEPIPDMLNLEINYNYQEKYNGAIKKFHAFMDQPDYISSKGDPDNNIIDMYCKLDDKVITKSYKIPENKILKMFKHIEMCRREDSRMMIYEKQSEYSGIMFDFDVLKKTNQEYLDDGVITIIYTKIANLLRTYVDLEHPDRPIVKPPNNPNIIIHMICTKKPKILLTDDKKSYKDGFHVLVPGIQITRPFKKFLIRKIKEDGLFHSVFSNIDLADGIDPNDIVDKNSAHVPVFFLGSSSKQEKPAYIIHSISELEINPNYLHDMSEAPKVTRVEGSKFDVLPDRSQVQNSKVVLAHEFSLNWEVPEDKHSTSIIKKRHYEPKERYLAEIQSNYQLTKADHDVENENENGALSMLTMYDVEAKFIGEVLDTLSEDRYTDYGKWFAVLCALAHTSKSYRPLAEKFSMKCAHKYNPVDFEHHWQSAIDGRDNKLGIGSIHYWAKMDNPVKYNEVWKMNIYTLLYKKIYDTQLEGSLQHYDIAWLLHHNLKDKYAYDNGGAGTWYEFILDEDSKEHGEVFKWRGSHKPPSSLRKYMSEVMPVMFDKIFDRIAISIEESAGSDTGKYHTMVKANLKVTCRKIRDNGFKNGATRECEQLFERIGFAKQLDRDQNIMGVGNGILKMDKHIIFIDRYHSHYISKFSPVNYREFNPYDTTTKKLLYALRNIFPDNEPDTMEFMMCYLASALDGRKKESLLVLLVGSGSNGKSTIMELFRETLGQYCVKMQMSFLTSRQKDSETASPALMSLMTARGALYSETTNSEVLQMAKVKEVTSGEAMAGRKLHEEQQNFKPNSIHLAAMNHEFETGGSNDHGTWRRLKSIKMKIKFCKENVDDYDPNNPLERLADPAIQAQWTEDPEVLSSFLAILCHYYEILHNKYGGIVENVPHPNIKRDTEAYRDRQDKINKFVNMRFVKTTDKGVKLPMFTIIEKYTRWYDSLYPDDKNYKKSLAAQLENSKLTKLIKRDRDEVYITGYRILENGEEKEADEIYLMDEMMKTKRKNEVHVESENPDEYYRRICREYNEKITERQAEIERQNQVIHNKRIQALAEEAEEKAKEAKSYKYNSNSDTNYKKVNTTSDFIDNKINNKTNTNKTNNIPKYDDSGFRIINTDTHTVDPDIRDMCDMNSDTSDDGSDSD